VLRTPDGDQPYNDLEFYVLVRGNALLAERRFRRALHELGEQLSPAAGLEVEFKVLTLNKLRRSPPSMFYYDLVMGHRWITGDAPARSGGESPAPTGVGTARPHAPMDALLAACPQHGEATRIPLYEATRLLMNRCSGLLFALVRLTGPTFTDADADFTGRNLAKAQLAFGDVLLAAQGQYHWSCLERQRRLAQFDFTPLPWAVPLKAHHAAGVEFKLHPTRSTESRAVLAARHQELCALGGQLWLWLEARRLARPFATARDYAVSTVDKCPETAPLRNRLVNGRAFGMAGLASNRYPRERLLHALALLLWEKSALTDPALRAVIQASLRTPAGDLAGLVSAYSKIWERFN
jgi:hypothetical protein